MSAEGVDSCLEAFKGLSALVIFAMPLLAIFGVAASHAAQAQIGSKNNGPQMK